MATKTKELLLTSFDSPAVIVPECQPDRIHSTKAAYFIEVNHVILQEFRKYTKREFIERFSPYQPGEKLIAINRKRCNCAGAPCEFCYNTGWETEYMGEIQLSSNIDDWQLIKVLDSKDGIENMMARGLLKNHKKDANPKPSNPYVFIVPQEITW